MSLPRDSLNRLYIVLLDYGSVIHPIFTCRSVFFGQPSTRKRTQSEILSGPHRKIIPQEPAENPCACSSHSNLIGNLNPDLGLGPTKKVPTASMSPAFINTLHASICLCALRMDCAVCAQSPSRNPLAQTCMDSAL